MDSSSDDSPMPVRKARATTQRRAVVLSDSEDENATNESASSRDASSEQHSESAANVSHAEAVEDEEPHADATLASNASAQQHSDGASSSNNEDSADSDDGDATDDSEQETGDDEDDDEEADASNAAASTSHASNFLDNSAAEVSAIVSSSADATTVDEHPSTSGDDVSHVADAANSSATSSIPIERSLIENDDTTSDVEDARIEARCYSPRTRQSMGIGRQDMLTDSEDSEVPESDDDDDEVGALASKLNSTALQSAEQRLLLRAASDNRSFADVSHVVSPEAEADASQVSQSSRRSSDVEVIPNAVQETVVLSSDDAEEILSSTPPRTPVKPVVRPLVQAKITSYTPTGGKQQQQLKYVSAVYMADQQKKRWELQAQLQKNRSLLATLAHTLPDMGAGLRLRLQKLEDELAKHDRYIETLRVDDEMMKKPAVAAAAAAAGPLKPDADDWSKISAAINAIKPEHMGAQGLNTFNTQKALTVDRLKQLHASLETCPKEDQLAPTPKGLRVELMDHQRYALSWMAWRERQKPKGGILADDMGLGKTLTMISLVLAMNQRDEDGGDEENEEESSDSEAENDDSDAQRRKSLHHGGTLVVCPASLINQWEGEVNNRLRRNKLTVVVHHGTKRDVRAKYLARNDMVITTYAIVSREHKDRGALFGIRWARIILDEAHVIRNHKAKQSEACCRLSGSRRWALTGTPIQNKEMDIYAQLRYLRCTPFDDLAVYKKWIGNQSTGNQERMNNIIRPMMLRRTKAQLQERGGLQGMPEKRVLTQLVELDKNEMNVYQRILTFSKTLFSQFLHQRAERHNDGVYRGEGDRPTFEQRHQPNEAYDRMHQRVKRMHGQQEIKSHQILTYILRLRQICCHPGLIDAMLEDADENMSTSEGSLSVPEVDLLEQLNRLNLNEENAPGRANSSQADVDGEGNVSGSSMNSSANRAISKASSKLLLRTNPVFNTHRASSKFRLALKILQEQILPAGDKAVVVSQWTSVLNMFREHLDVAGVKYVRLTGEVAVKDRNELVVDFNSKTSDVKLMLLSLAAGGVGLNLIGGNHLLLLDPHWNPQLEAQAQDRVFRVGQTKPVTIYKFLCSDTIEERIVRMQEKKLSIATDMLNGVKHTGGSKLTIDDMRALFDM